MCDLSGNLTCSDASNIIDVDGAILSMHLRNFFCHDNLEIKFHKKINFIVGRNGSGKSAILTALVVGLGGRAAVTNRGTSLSSFVKKGTNSAHIEIKIKNDSPHAYKHDVYGDEITVIRTISASGNSSYRVKNKSGHTVSTKHEDVAMICSVHDIQVDNPICVLNQDDARNFHASDAKKKYSLFRKATNMDVIETNYNSALKKCEQAKMTLKKKKQAFGILEEELRKLKMQFDEMKSQDEVQAHMRHLEDEYHWSEINDVEKAFRQMTKELNKQKTKVENLNERVCTLQRNDVEFQLNHDNIKKELDTVRVASASQDADYQAMCKSLQEIKTQWKTCCEDLKKKRDYISRETVKVTDLTREVNTATNKNLADERQSLQSKLSQVQEKLEEVNARKATTDNDLNQTRGAVSHEHTKLLDISRKRDHIYHSSKQVKAQLNELNVRGKDSLAVYGKNMTDLVAAVKGAHSQGLFSEMPRGPVGAYIKVRDKKWSSALEHIMGGSLMTFCVNNDKDSKQLFNIMRQVYGNESKPSITTCKFYNKVHDVSKNSVRPPAGLRSSLDCLQVDDAVITNYLIDELRMETILLVPTHDQAINLTSDERKVPQNLIKVVTMDQTEFYPAPNYRSYGGKGRPSRFLQVSTAERKKQLQEEYTTLEKNVSTLDLEHKEVKCEHEKLNKREDELDLQLRKLLKAQQTLEGQIESVKSGLRDLEGGHIKVLTEELNQSKEKLAKLQEEEKISSGQETQFRSKAKTLEANRNGLKQQRDTRLTTLHETLNDEQLKTDRNRSELLMAQHNFNDENTKLAEITSKHTKSEEEVQIKIGKAEQLCTRINNTRPLNVIISDLKKVKSKLESMQRSGLSKQQVAETLIEKESLHKTTSKVILHLGVLIERLEKVVKRHLHSAIQLQALIASRVQYCFQSILKIRDYMGSMELNNEKCTLEIKCTGRDLATVRAASTTRSLSGGERSYATVAFIIALWECMELPFYFLDEFDVFMDNVNRKTTMELLIDHARTNPHRQYVFLTPHDTSILKSTEDVKIHRLADPVREVFSQA